MKVAVCAITFRRPEGLRRLLRALDALTFQSEPPGIGIVIVDNDPECSARALCDELRSEVRWPLRYDTEPRRGIPFARNKAVACAVDTADFIAFIDDDEVPEPTWLDELLRVQRAYNAGVVTGPVVPRLPDQVPTWIIRGRFFDLRRYASGQCVDVAFTGNVLVRSAVYHAMDKHFDERLALTGGSDTHFFRRVHRAGFSIVWADDAVVREWIPKSRARAGWLIKRAYRAGVMLGFTRVDMAPSWSTRLVLVAKAAVWIAIGILSTPAGLMLGRAAFVKCFRHAAYGSGYLASLTGARYEEYKTTHGT